MFPTSSEECSGVRSSIDRRSFLAASMGVFGLTNARRAYASSDSIRVTSEEELIQAIQEMTPGDEVVIAAGTYEDVELEVGLEASKQFPVLIRAESDYSAVFTGTTQFRITGSHIVFSGLRFENSEEIPRYGVFNLRNADNCRITNCEFEDLEGMWGTVVINYGAHGNRIDNNHFSDCRYRAVRVGVHEEALEYGPPVRNRIDHNIIRDIPESGGGSAEAITIGSWGYPWNQYETYTIVENNLFLRCNGENEIISVKTRANIIRNNAFIHCITGELVLRSTDDTTVEGNRFEYTNHGIRVHGTGHRIVNNVIANPRNTGIRVAYGSDDPTYPTVYERVHSTVVANNTVINAGDTGILVGAMKGGTQSNESFTEPPFNHPTGEVYLDVAPYDSIFVNNIVVGRDGILFKIVDAPGNIYSHNLLHAEDGAEIGDAGNQSILDKPKFRWAENGDYRLAEEGPGAGTGTEGGYPVMPIDQKHSEVYELGAEGTLPEVGPSEAVVAEVLALPPLYLEDDLPPSRYHILLLD